ncbi:hypothetical protein EDC01DRAFT_220039 [Geopyxis carbonaria]|nr:hypothetical protein EDC01DRAFT_220039 [Geopyxis carbonaria]
MRNPPPSEYTTWPKPNYDNPETKGISLLVIGIILITIAFIVVLMRLYVRWHILHNVGVDDWLMVLALIPAIGLTTSTLIGTRYGWGKHIWDIEPGNSSSSLQISWISQLTFVFAMVPAKLSICFSYRRLSQKKSFSRVLLGTKVFIGTWGIAFLCVVVFRCWPISAYWTDVLNRKNKCINETAPLLTSSFTNVFTDFWLVILPIPTLWKLQLPSRQRIVLIFLMSLGILACVAGVVRVVSLHKTLILTYDVTWEGYNTWLWTAVEIDLGIITGSVPPLRPLVRRYFPRFLETNSVGRRSMVHPGEPLPYRDHPDRTTRILSNVMSTTAGGASRKAHFSFDSTEYLADRKMPEQLPKQPIPLLIRDTGRDSGSHLGGQEDDAV